MTTLILLPQRYQVVNGLDPLPAGIRMLPLLCFSALGSGLGAITLPKHNVSFYLLLLGSTLQLLGMGLITSLSTSIEIEARQYGFQMILGMGFGLGLSSLIVVARVEVSAKDSGMPPLMIAICFKVISGQISYCSLVRKSTCTNHPLTGLTSLPYSHPPRLPDPDPCPRGLHCPRHCLHAVDLAQHISSNRYPRSGTDRRGSAVGGFDRRPPAREDARYSGSFWRCLSGRVAGHDGCEWSRVDRDVGSLEESTGCKGRSGDQEGAGG